MPWSCRPSSLQVGLGKRLIFPSRFNGVPAERRRRKKGIVPASCHLDEAIDLILCAGAFAEERSLSTKAGFMGMRSLRRFMCCLNDEALVASSG